MSWVFQGSDPMGGAAGEAYANTLKSPGMRQEHVLAREAIQNSVDAGVEGRKVRVRFRHAILSGAKKSDFVEAARLEDLAKRTGELELADPNCLTSLARPRTQLSLFYVEDYNAVGLNGDPHDKNSNFYRLLLSLGDRSKSRTAAGSGGSYGFGKSVYSSSSAIQTIFAYTRFVDEDRVEKTRIFGCGYYASHEHRGKSYGGRAWLGTKPRTDKEGRTVVDPLEGKLADDLATRLGFHLRQSGELGTSILIVDATLESSEIIVGIEDWWWPRLVENRLDVEVVDATGKASVPRPRKNPELRPFIEAFEIARGISVPKPTVQKLNPLSKLGDLPLGSCGFVVAPLKEDGAPAIRADRTNTVALIRAPLMVVSYKSFSETAPVVVGAFMASEEVDTYLKRSEPPAHDRWDPDSGNLRDAEGSAKGIVNAVLSRIKGGLKRFQGEASPASPPKQRRLSILERALGQYFRPQGSGPKTQPDHVQSMLHLEFTKQPYPEATANGMLRLRGAFSVGLDGKADEESVRLRLRLASPVLEDDGQEGDDLPLKIQAGVPADIDVEDSHLVRFFINRGKKAHFIFESEEYDPNWSVRVRPEIDLEEAR